MFVKECEVVSVLSRQTENIKESICGKVLVLIIMICIINYTIYSMFIVNYMFRSPGTVLLFPIK